MRRNTVLAALFALLIALILPGSSMATYPDRNGRLVFQADTGSGYESTRSRRTGTTCNRSRTSPRVTRWPATGHPTAGRSCMSAGSETAVRVELMNADGSNVRALAGTGLEAQVVFAFEPFVHARRRAHRVQQVHRGDWRLRDLDHERRR